MPSIRSVKNTIDELIELQNGAAKSIKTEISRVRSEKDADDTQLKILLRNLIPADDHKRYADLTNVFRHSGKGEDFTALVARWTEEDHVNRDERTKIGKQWGSRENVAERTATSKENLDIVSTALPDVSAEITAFDEATTKITVHNEKYPKKPITEENHDGYEKWNFWRFLGWITFINRGPHDAYRAIAGYTKEYGDYYEDARNIHTLRETEKKLQNNQQEERQRFEELSAIGQHMDTLDASYKGSDGIAASIQAMVRDLLIAEQDFAGAFAGVIAGEQASEASFLAAKHRSFRIIEANLMQQLHEVLENTEDLQSPLQELKRGMRVIPGENIYFDSYNLESTVQDATTEARNGVKRAQKAREQVDDYIPPADQSYDDLQKTLDEKANYETGDARVNIDLSSVEQAVRREIREYERKLEEERRRRAEEARRQQEALARTFEAAARASRRSSPSLRPTFGTSTGISHRSSGGHDNIFGGSTGISRRR